MSAQVRCSDWEADVLSEVQLKYAAADAHVAVRIFARLVDDLSVDSMWFMFRRKNRNIWNNLDKLCWQYSDVHYKAKYKADGIA